VEKLRREATVIALRNGILKAATLLAKAKDQDESHLLAVFIDRAAHHIEKLKSEESSKASTIKIGSLIKNRKLVRTMKEKAGIVTVQDLMASPLSNFYSALAKDTDDGKFLDTERRRAIAKSLYEALSAMHSGAIGKNIRSNPVNKGTKKHER
jgi:hypothetical protein